MCLHIAASLWTTLLNRVIKTPQDVQILQEDIDKLPDSEKKPLMEFNADKCDVLQISNKRKNHEASYSIHCHTLTLTMKAKYIGFILTPNMSWNAHIDMTTRKANSTLAFLRRNLYSCPRSNKETLYMCLVRPQLEYAFTVWDPHTKSNQSNGDGPTQICHICIWILPQTG